MNWKTAGSLNALKEQGRICQTIDTHKILLIWHEDNVIAIQSQCPHFKLPLTKGVISKNNTITCPFHKSEFDLTTGAVKQWSPWPPAVGTVLGKISKPKTLKVYPVRIENDEIQIQLTPETATK